MIYLLRHLQKDYGVFDANHETYADYTKKLPLTAAGRSNAQKIAAKLSKQVAKNTKIISSDFRRASETAEIIATHLGIELEIDPRLAERTLATGDFSMEEIRGFNEVSLRDWNWAAPGGESMSAVAERMRQAIKDAKNRGEDLIVVSHSRSLQAYLSTVKDASISSRFQSSDVDFRVQYGEIIILKEDNL